MKRQMVPGLTRRQLLQVTAGGVVVSGLGIGRGMAEPYDGPFTWISPRGTLEVLDDYGFWIGKKMGYFDGLDVEMQNWRMVAAPAGLSPEDEAAIAADIETMAKATAWQEALATKGWADTYLAGDAFRAQLEEETATTAAVLKDIGLVE